MAATTLRSQATTPTAEPSPGQLKALVGAVHLTLALLLVQAVLAGIFVSDTYANNSGGDGEVTAHGVVADAIWVVALLVAGVAAVRLRRSTPALVVLSAGYFVLALVETGIGHLISDNSLLGISGNRNGLIALHIPLAIVLFALGGYIATKASRLARTA